MKKQIADLLLYRWRYILGYGTLIAIFITAITISTLYTPGGITQAEINTIERTNALANGELTLPNLPLHLLQLVSFSLFGVSIFTIKLPAIILSIVSAVAIFFLLRRWFKSNITILSMLIMATTGQFIFLAQHATTQILYVAYSALILLFASMILQKAKGHLIWKISLAITVALSCYTPYFIYINLGLLIAALFHPHPRLHLFKRSQRINWLIAGAVFALVLSPLAYLITQSPALLTEVLGYESLRLNVFENIKTLVQSYFWTEPLVIGNHIAPILDFSSLALIILGAPVMFRHRYTARTYVIAAWLLLTLPVLILRPQLTTIALVPLFILLAMGVETLLGQWYRLFPKNPYARATGLIMIVGLIGVMVLSGVERFTNGYRHLPLAAQRFSTDISLLKKELANRPVRTHLVAHNTELALYEALAMHQVTNLTVSTDQTEASTANIIVTHRALEGTETTNWQLQKIAANGRASDADRLYLYKAD